jgi:hypothetical protein
MLQERANAAARAAQSSLNLMDAVHYDYVMNLAISLYLAVVRYL